jgi:hypothetical protein
MVNAATRIVLVALLVLAAVACGPGGFDRPKLKQGLGAQLPPAGQDIARALESRPAARGPLRIAVYMQPEPLGGRGSRAWSWTGRDREILLSETERLRSDKLLADMFVLSDLVVANRDVQGLRVAAAHHGADALLLVAGNADVDAYSNPLSILYVTIIGYWLFPGTHRDALFLARGAMWDVRTGSLYLTIDTEAQARTMRPGAFANREAAIDQAKQRALDTFRDDFVRRIRRLSSV